MKHKNYDFRTGFIDLLLCSFAAVIVLFIISTLLINPQQKTVTTEGIKKHAEYIIEITWSKDADCDVDLWIADPTKSTISYQRKDQSLMNLERDDMGFVNDVYDILNDTFKSNFNGEIGTLRGFIPGEYSISVHLYSCRVQTVPMAVGDALNLPVNIKITKLNPSVIIVKEKTVQFSRIYEEVPVINFTLDAEGKPVNWDETPYNIVQYKKGNP